MGSNKKNIDLMEAVEVSFSFKQKDGTNCNFSSFMPLVVANEISFDVIDWRNRWFFTPNSYNEYLENLKDTVKNINHGKQ